MIDWRFIWETLLAFKSKLIWGQAVTFLAIALSIPIPLLLPLLVDEVLLNKPSTIVHSIDALWGHGSALYYILIVLCAVVLLRLAYFLASVWQVKIFTFLAKHVTFSVRTTLLAHLQTVSMREYESLGSGAIGANLITDVNTLDSFIANGASKLIASVLTLVGVAVVMIAIHPLLGAVIFIFQPLVMWLTRKISKRVGDLKKEENSTIEAFQQEVGETLDLFGQIKASNKEGYFFSRLRLGAQAIQKASNDFGYKSVVAERFSYTLFLSIFELFRALGLLMVVYSDLSIGMMFAMFGYIWFMMTPVQELLSLQYGFASAQAALGRMNRLLTLEREPNGVATLTGEGITIKLEHVDFFYQSNTPLLHDISMTIAPKEKVAIIGSSGSGKTTLAQVIAGFYPHRRGTLSYNDQNSATLSKKSLRSRVFLVLQMPILFNDTLRFNVTMGEVYSDADIMQALSWAQIASTVEAMPNGLDTVVGRHGIRLSGGQRQRLAIARMILANPDVVIFDESTSALDVHTEAKLYESLASFLADKTVITIAHRLSTVVQANTIYVLESGRIVEWGSHTDLEQAQGHYYDFLQGQKV